ncbi:putative GCN5-related N-acetyltransferase [Actinoplanes missouriensis 431]|uniref:Putative GCN5-related N-acetyltransferase n=1 Tax=Actinoplanes missouriensis (strain ATCC 14538 / DSM 43046 / CBS 188.64 / JCM 3121 / NBRC 102363 / NCIMB 12654 / NRRL B-3342 / UNCC 431) TaxID=512565 RepID=I0H9L8_ACTM4|nr:GNAT family N-acetyltransferase [Actinoplanes missouriensis]BAL89705.1 putative GCN5-related N-acetyltransferase [Actinoplanes missouriensis 431]
MHVLDDPVRQSLLGRHAHLARRVGNAVTYEEGVATFAAVPADPSQGDWDDLGRLLGSGGLADLFSAPVSPPASWPPVFELEGYQMVLDRPLTAPAPAPELGPADVPDMMALTELTRPGPFQSRTIELGTFYGIRENGTLIAMAGERLQPPGWTEISSVCTAPEARGRGLAADLVRTAASRILARGDQPFLHVAAANTTAVRLYERLGFAIRRRVRFHGYRVP